MLEVIFFAFLFYCIKMIFIFLDDLINIFDKHFHLRYIQKYCLCRPSGARVGEGGGQRGRLRPPPPQSLLTMCPFFSKGPLNVPFLKILKLKQ